MIELNNNEKIVLNSISQDFNIVCLSRENILNSLSFSCEINADEDVAELLNSLKDKIEHMLESEWNALKKCIPLKLEYEAYSP